MLQRPFDVMVVDLHLQGMDGIAFLQEALKIWPWLGVVIISGFLDPAVMEQLGRMNIHHAVEKPVEWNMLIRKVQEVARDKRALIAAPAPDAPAITSTTKTSPNGTARLRAPSPNGNPCRPARMSCFTRGCTARSSPTR